MSHLDAEIEDYPDDEIYADAVDHPAPTDQRWRPVAVTAGVVLVLAVVATVLIVNGGDNASTPATVLPSPSRTVIATPAPTAPTAAPTTSLPPETVTTLPPRQTPAPAPTHTPTAAPSAPPTAPPETSPPPAVNPRTIVYTVTGSKQLLDLVTVIYTDEQGLPHTDFNVALPWSKTVVLNPGVQNKSVVATSLYSRLNCAITNAEGQTIAVSTTNTMIATCTR
ncbi:MmpS family transport accessory protein [Mycobacterium botniense]|nr:MmpS family transport accessory protein [Mycobacterium botniense]